MLQIKTSHAFLQERKYIFDVIFRDFLGIDFELVTTHQNWVCISYKDSERKLFLADTFFQMPAHQWLKKESLPSRPLKQFSIPQEFANHHCSSENIPILYGEEKGIFEKHELVKSNSHWIPIDIFGSCFFMLTRYEECVIEYRDQHQRFSSTQSIAYQENFLTRPIVNEYVCFLASLIQKQWPQIKIKKHQYQFKLSCDVDQPFDDYLYSNPHAARRIIGDLIRRKNPKQAVSSLIDTFRLRKYGLEADKNYTFDWMMDICEQANIQNAFYFICGHTCNHDGDYKFEDPRIKTLLKNIYSRGHEIGIHGSYNAYNDATQLKKEFAILRDACASLHVEQQAWGGRQHYLRWDSRVSWKVWQDAGLSYDSSVGYSDHIGFRCGTCYPFHPFDWQSQTKLQIKEVPLIVMEGTLAQSQYMDLGFTEKMLCSIQNLRDQCQMHNGAFTLLWHNTSLVSEESREIFKQVVTL